MNTKEVLPLKTESCLYELPLSKSKEKLKYMSRYIVYKSAEQKSHLSERQVNCAMKIASLVPFLMIIMVLLKIEAFFYNPVIPTLLILITFLITVKIFDLNYYAYCFLLFIARLKGKESNIGQIDFYEEYIHIHGFKPFFFKNIKIHYFFKDNDLYMFFYERTIQWWKMFIIINATNIPPEFDKFLKDKIKRNG